MASKNSTWVMNIFPHEVKEVIRSLENRFQHVKFELGEPKILNEIPKSIFHRLKMVGLYAHFTSNFPEDNLTLKKQEDGKVIWMLKFHKVDGKWIFED